MISKKKRVLILVENLPVPNDRRVWLEATALRDAGYDVSIISIKGKNARKSRETLEGIRIYRYPAPGKTHSTLSFVWEFAYCWLYTLILSIYIAFRHGFDIIHACNPPETFWLIGRFYKPFGVKFIFDHHDLSPEMYQSRFGKKGSSYKLLLLLERLTFSTADVVITTNQTHLQVAIDRGNYPRDRIFIVRSGPDERVIRPLEARPSLKNGRRYLVSYLGVLNPQDGVDLFLKAIDHIVHNLGREDIHFIIMGAGDAEEELHDLCRQLQLDAFVQFTGWVDRKTIAVYLSTSDICVDTIPKTPYSDAATMNKILEYMSAGRPIVAFDLKETRVSAGETAWYAKPNDVVDLAEKIVLLLADEEQRIAMGKIGRQMIEEELSWDHQKPNLIRAYDKLELP